MLRAVGKWKEKKKKGILVGGAATEIHPPPT